MGVKVSWWAPSGARAAEGEYVEVNEDGYITVRGKAKQIIISIAPVSAWPGFDNTYTRPVIVEGTP